jgi:hypothetical protein
MNLEGCDKLLTFKNTLLHQRHLKYVWDLISALKNQIDIKPRMHKFSNNLGATSKLYGARRVASSMLHSEEAQIFGTIREMLLSG